MQCPSCRVAIADSLLQCDRCNADVSLTLATPDGRQLGPYSLAVLSQYVSSGQISPDSQASIGAAPWVPLHHAFLAFGVQPSAPGAPPVAEAQTPGPAFAPEAGSPPTHRAAGEPGVRPTLPPTSTARRRRRRIRLASAAASTLVVVGIAVGLGIGPLREYQRERARLASLFEDGKPFRIADVRFPLPGTSTTAGNLVCQEGTLRVSWRRKRPRPEVTLVMASYVTRESDLYTNDQIAGHAEWCDGALGFSTFRQTRYVRDDGSWSPTGFGNTVPLNAPSRRTIAPGWRVLVPLYDGWSIWTEYALTVLSLPPTSGEEISFRAACGLVPGMRFSDDARLHPNIGEVVTRGPMLFFIYSYSAESPGATGLGIDSPEPIPQMVLSNTVVLE